MAFFAKLSFLLFLLILLSSQPIYARESQFFNKIPSNSNGEAKSLKEAPEEIVWLEKGRLYKPEQDQNFIPEKEDGGFGLYWRNYGKFASVDAAAVNAAPEKPTTTPDTYLPYLPYDNGQEKYLPKYLPKNYNTESYVAEPEGYHGNFGTAQEKSNNNYNTAENDHHNTQQDTAAVTKGNEYYNNHGGDRYDGQQQEWNDIKFAQNGYTTGAGDIDGNYYNGEDVKALEKQGMSDTRFLENGKYFYDINMQKNGRGPYENSGGFEYKNYGNGGYYGNQEIPYENKEQFEDSKFEEGFP